MLSVAQNKVLSSEMESLAEKIEFFTRTKLIYLEEVCPVFVLLMISGKFKFCEHKNNL
jgi:hypothetical protein